VNDYANIVAIVRGLYGDSLGEPSQLSMNEMNLEAMYQPEADRPARPLEDTDISRMRERICTLFRLNAGLENLREAVRQVADERRYHPIRSYLASLNWDGEQRLPRVAKEILGIPEPSPLTVRMLRCWFISAVARAMRPGCKVDTALVLKGEQGFLKSTFFAVLGGEFFSDTKMDISNKDALLQLAATWIYEWSELENVTSAKDAGEVKAFTTSSFDTFRPPFARSIVRHPRNAVIVGSTNKDQFLNDPTGSRRFWVVVVDQRIAVEALRAWRDQLWAEALAAFESGETWWLEADEETAREDAAEEHTVEDALHLVVAAWANTQAAHLTLTNNGYLTMGDIMRGALGLEPGKWQKRDETRVGQAMAKLEGWTRTRVTAHGLRPRVFLKKESVAPK
jgi:putative DNA primase/helicase